jgi:hypothetical protein
MVFWACFRDMIYEGSTARLVQVLTGTVSVLLTAFCSIDGIHFALLLFARKPDLGEPDMRGIFYIITFLDLPSVATGSTGLIELSQNITPTYVASSLLYRPSISRHELFRVQTLSLVASLQPQSFISSLDRLVPFFVHLTPSSSWTWKEAHISTALYSFCPSAGFRSSFAM